MSRLKILVLIALFTFAVCLAVGADAVAGEKIKCWTGKYLTKFEAIEVGDEEGHAVATYEIVGTVKNLEGKPLYDGWAYRETGLLDTNSKTGVGSGHGYFVSTDKDGDMIYATWEGKMTNGVWKSGTLRISNGTGKYVGIKGRGTWWDSTYVTPKVSHCPWEAEVELPR